ncbi:hypothetical protein Pelo_3598 [Pelomyxa schiedti]|nr:hypothetical protein Pelo_3598 [Pelomyxa schiedti]
MTRGVYKVEAQNCNQQRRGKHKYNDWPSLEKDVVGKVASSFDEDLKKCLLEMMIGAMRHETDRAVEAGKDFFSTWKDFVHGERFPAGVLIACCASNNYRMFQWIWAQDEAKTQMKAFSFTLLTMALLMPEAKHSPKHSEDYLQS